MGEYGQAALAAVDMIVQGVEPQPREAWGKAVVAVLRDSPSSQKKSCPRDAFLGLCELGVVAGVPAGFYTSSEKNKLYVERGLRALRSDALLIVFRHFFGFSPRSARWVVLGVVGGGQSDCACPDAVAFCIRLTPSLQVCSHGTSYRDDDDDQGDNDNQGEDNGCRSVPRAQHLPADAHRLHGPGHPDLAA